MTPLRTGLVGIATLACVIGTAFAGGSWNDKVSFRYANATSLKVTEPEGFKVSILLPDGEKTGTIPELFSLPDQDAFVKVTLTSPQGDAWSKKVEIRSKQQTELAVQFKADAPAAEPKKAGRTYVGKFLNQIGGCGRSYHATQVKIDFLRNSSGEIVKHQLIDAGKTADVEIEGGKYDVRVYLGVDGDWKYVHTSTWDIGKDGWLLGFGCPPGSKQPTIVDH